jgi:branched-chain amino acid transport system substrate-binding protein
VTAGIEKTQLEATELAIQQINASGGVLGRPIVPYSYDPGSDTGSYGSCAKRLMIRDDVNVIFGCYTSTSRKAVVPVVERLDGLLWYPTLYEGYECSPNVVYCGAAPNQNLVKLIDHLFRGDARRFYFVGSDYVYAHATNRTLRALISDRGGKVVGERYHALRAERQDFSETLHDIRRIEPDVIFSTIVGVSTTYFYQEYHELGFDSKKMPIASLTTTETEVALMGNDVGEGHITSASYFQSVDTPENIKFVEQWKKRYGSDQATNMCAEAAFFQMHIFAEILARTGSDDRTRLRRALFETTFDAPQGEVSIGEQTGHANLWTRIGKCQRDGQFELVHESSGPSAPDPYLLKHGVPVVD